MKQYIFSKGGSYYLVDIYEDGTVSLKIKENGWSDTWSLPIDEVKP
jgi:hypothetical protein